MLFRSDFGAPKPQSTVELAANRAPAAQLPVLLAILAIIALSLVTATYARLFLASAGTTIDARTADAESSQEYIDARKEEADAEYELERHRSRTRAADMLIEVWRSEQANARTAEKVR